MDAHLHDSSGPASGEKAIKGPADIKADFSLILELSVVDSLVSPIPLFLASCLTCWNREAQLNC